MSGEILLNLDSEDEGELYIGCAGGIDTVAEFQYENEMTPISHLCFRITVKGLKGGHSGGDIHLGRGNANKILNRFLYQMMTTYQEDFHLYEFNGGNLRNAIPREASAVFSLSNITALHTYSLERIHRRNRKRTSSGGTGLRSSCETEPHRDWSIDSSTSYRLITSLYGCPHGVYAMSQDIPGLVELQLQAS